jgi:hypothetical protein
MGTVLREQRVDTEQTKCDGNDHEHGDIGRQEQRYALHRFAKPPY